MNVATYDIVFTPEKPDALFNPLLATLQRLLSQQKTRAGKSIPLQQSHRILIVDMQREQAFFIEQWLTSAGYKVLTVTNALEGFTLFLQGIYIPLVVIQGNEETGQRLFMQRLFQQMIQKYDVELSLIRIHTQSVTGPLSPVSGPLLQQKSTSSPLLPPITKQLAPETKPLGPIQGSFSSEKPTTQMPAWLSTSENEPITDKALEKRIQKQPPKQKVSLEGLSIGRYQIETLLGNGPIGSVYVAYDRLREQQIALKAIQTDILPYFVIEISVEEENLLTREAALLSKLPHPHILSPMQTGKSYISGSPFIYKTMPYHQAGNLGQWLSELNRERMFTPREVIHVIIQLADALQYLHDRQILFHDFKVNNILLTDNAKNMLKLNLLLSDFIVTTGEFFLPDTTDALPYIAPERWDGQEGPASDQYALAVLTYELLAGRPPFQGTTPQILRRLHQTMQPQPPSTFNTSISTSINTIILKALAKRPEDRFASISLFAQTLLRYCS